MHQLVMTSKASYSLEELDIVVQQIKEEELSYRKAAAQHGIPRVLSMTMSLERLQAQKEVPQLF